MDCDSDSDDNIFGNAAAKLAKLKSLYTEDKIESVDLLQGTASVKDVNHEKSNEIPLNPPLPTTKKPKKPRKSKKNYNEEKVEFTFESLDDFDIDLPVVLPPPQDTATTKTSTRKSKRATKSNAANKVPTLRELPAIRVIPKQKKKGPNRRCGKKDIHVWLSSSFSRRSLSSLNDMLPIASTSSLPSPSLHHHQDDSSPEGPILIGERDYHDNSHNVKIFDNAPKATNNVVEVMEDEELSVKVYWQSWEIYKFNVRTHQQIKLIFEYFAKKENIEMNKLLFMYNDKILSPTDTPLSFNYNIAKVIDGGIVKEAMTYGNKNKQNKPTGIKVKFQTQNSKKAFEVSIDKNELLSSAMIMFSESIDKPMKQLKFYFDGDIIQGSQTLEELDFEGGECIDVKFV